MRFAVRKVISLTVNAGLMGLVALLAGPAAAFNAQVHRVVGYVAEAHVCEETLVAVQQLDRERDLAAAGLWADEIRAYKHMDFAKRWHYVNVPDAQRVEEFLAGKRRDRRGDVLFAIDQFAQLLGNTSADQLDRAQAYRFLVHFVADVHQPLHVGRKSDQGGNRINVSVDGRRTSLHSFWDGFELSNAMADPRDYAAYLGEAFGGKRVELGGDPIVWAQESKDFRPQVYAFGPGKGFGVYALSDEYRDNAITIMNLRVYQAGRRLASLLDAIFCEGDVNR